MASSARGSFSDGSELDLLVLLPDGRSVTYTAHANCPMMDLLIQIASKENLKPSAYVIEPLMSSPDHEDHHTKQIISYKPNTPIGALNTQVIRLALKNQTGHKMPSTNSHSSQEKRINHSESFSHRVKNFNKMAGVSAVEICNDPDGFAKLSEDTKRIKSRSNFITSTLPPQVSGNYESTKTLLKTFRLQIHLPFDQLHVIRASPDDTIQDVLDIIHEERGLKLERYNVLKTNDPDLIINMQGTLKEYQITELTLKLRHEYDIIRNDNPKKIKKENSSHFKSAFKSFFHQLKPSSRSNSVTELQHSTTTLRPRSEIPAVHHTEFTKPRPPPRKRAQAPPPPPPVQQPDRVANTATSRSHTASESSCESTCDGSVGGSAPATLPRRCRLGSESVSTLNLATEHPVPTLRRGVSDLAVNKHKYPRRKRMAPRPPTLISNEDIKEDKIEEQTSTQKIDIPSDNIISFVHVINSLNEPKHDFQKPFENCSSDNIKVNENDEISEDGIETFENQKTQTVIEQKVISETLNHKIFSESFENQKNEINENLTKKTINDDKKIIKEVPTEKITAQNDSLVKLDVFTQEISNGQHLIAVNIDIEDPKDPNDHVNPVQYTDNQKILKSNFEENTLSMETQIDIKEKHKYDTQIENHDLLKSNQVKVEVHRREDVCEKSTCYEDVEIRHPPLASQAASYHTVETLPIVEKPESKVLPTFLRTVVNVNNRSTLPPTKLTDSSARKQPQRSVSSGATVASKPTVEELLKQIKKIKEKPKIENRNGNHIYPALIDREKNGYHLPEIVGHIEKRKSLEESKQNGSTSTCTTPPVSPESEDVPILNGNTEETKSHFVTDVVAKLCSIEKQVAEPASSRSRPLPTFMLTSWAEEKRAPVVNRIADYGSRSSVKMPIHDDIIKKESATEKPLPFSMSSTLPRPFAKPMETIKSSTLNRLPPTIINVLEKTEVQKQNENPPHFITNGHQSAYTKLNLHNMSPTIIHDSPEAYNENGVTDNVQKPSWQLVQDASKKLQENKQNGENTNYVNDQYKHVHQADNHKPFENCTGKNIETRNVYKYPKPLQFQLGTWNDKAKGLKIEPDVNLDKKSDPPLVKEIDEVAVWSMTY